MERRRRVNVSVNIHGSYKYAYSGVEEFRTNVDYKSLHVSPLNITTSGVDKLELLFIYVCRILEKIPLEMMIRLFHDNSTNVIIRRLYIEKHPDDMHEHFCDRLYEFFNLKLLRIKRIKLKNYSYNISKLPFPEILSSYRNDIVQREAIKIIPVLGQNVTEELNELYGTGIFVDDCIVEFKDETAAGINIIVEYLENTGLVFADYTRVERKTASSIVLRYSKMQNIMQCKYYIAWELYEKANLIGLSFCIENGNAEAINNCIFRTLTPHLSIIPDKGRPGHSKIVDKIRPSPYNTKYEPFLFYAYDTTDFQILQNNPDGTLIVISPDDEPFKCINRAFDDMELNEIFDRERYGGESKVFGIREDAFIKPYMDTMRTCISEDAARKPPGEYSFNTFLNDPKEFYETISKASFDGVMPEGVADIHTYQKFKIGHSSRVVATLYGTTNENIIKYITENENSIMIFDNVCAGVENLPSGKPDKVFDFDPEVARGKTRKRKRNSKKSKKRKSKRSRK